MTDQAPADKDYGGIHGDIVALLETARRAAARNVNALMTASYWEIGWGPIGVSITPPSPNTC